MNRTELKKRKSLWLPWSGKLLPVTCCLGLLTLFASFRVRGQEGGQAKPARYVYGRMGGIVKSNVPLNEISTHAIRHFYKRFPGVDGESWVKLDNAYLVSFEMDTHLTQAWFDLKGNFLYVLTFYEGSDIGRELKELIGRSYPGYRIGVVTRITDGEKTFYLAKIENNATVRSLSICEDRIEEKEVLINGSAPLN